MIIANELTFKPIKPVNHDLGEGSYNSVTLRNTQQTEEYLKLN
jgi:predicted DNA-binding antitoxin AbrB/MazE fold protein